MVIPVKTSGKGYDTVIKRGALKDATRLFDLQRKALIVTDSGVPEKYVKTVCALCKEPYIVTLKSGEEHKNAESLMLVLKEMAEKGFTRRDCVCAVGGGVPGDLSGFAAACYMRGVDFYNIPTTVLSQVDSSVGGKTAVDLLGYKNIIGAFFAPRGVLIDPDTLKTLPERQINAGLCEALKMACTLDGSLFEVFEKENIVENIDKIIEKAVLLKRAVVEQKEKEQGLRRVLNFGHTLGHAIEREEGFSRLHGECVALGMIPFCSQKVRERLVPALLKLSLPTKCELPPERLRSALMRDKKAEGEEINVVFVPEVGKYEFLKMTVPEILSLYERSALI